MPLTLTGLGILFHLLFSPLALAEPEEWPQFGSARGVGAEQRAGDAALIVGVGDYLSVQDIPGATDNARDWTAWFDDGLGLSATKTLLDAQATREEILLAAKQVAARVQPGGRLWIVYIGHGAPSRQGEEGTLVGVDVQQTALSLEARSVKMSELLSAVQAGAQAETVIILDACFSGHLQSGDLLPGLAPLVPVYALRSPQVTLLSAGGRDEYAGPLSTTDRPAFSYLVLGALRGWGDRDGDGAVTTREAVDYANRALFKTLTGRSQTPELQGDDLALVQKVGEKGPDLTRLVAPPTAALTKRPVGTLVQDEVYGGWVSQDDVAARIPEPLRFSKSELLVAADSSHCEREADAYRHEWSYKVKPLYWSAASALLMVPAAVVGVRGFKYGSLLEAEVGWLSFGGLAIGASFGGKVYSERDVPSQKPVAACISEHGDRSSLQPGASSSR